MACNQSPYSPLPGLDKNRLQKSPSTQASISAGYPPSLDFGVSCPSQHADPRAHAPNRKPKPSRIPSTQNIHNQHHKPPIPTHIPPPKLYIQWQMYKTKETSAYPAVDPNPSFPVTAHGNNLGASSMSRIHGGVDLCLFNLPIPTNKRKTNQTEALNTPAPEA